LEGTFDRVRDHCGKINGKSISKVVSDKPDRAALAVFNSRLPIYDDCCGNLYKNYKI
jgi:hypothetical protein